MVYSLLMYYFKSVNTADNMKRVIGSINRQNRTWVHSFLKVNDQILDNTFALDQIRQWQTMPNQMYQIYLTSKYNDGDPGDPKYNVDPKSSEIGTYNFLLFGSKTANEWFDFGFFQDWKTSVSSTEQMKK